MSSGLVVGALALVACLVLFRPKRLAAFDSLVALGVLVGVGAVLLQNLVDLGLEVPAVSVAVVTVLASCWGSVKGNRPAWTRPWLAWLATGALLVGGGITASEPQTGGGARARI